MKRQALATRTESRRFLVASHTHTHTHTHTQLLVVPIRGHDTFLVCNFYDAAARNPRDVVVQDLYDSSWGGSGRGTPVCMYISYASMQAAACA